jgi:hypothetical protein
LIGEEDVKKEIVEPSEEDSKETGGSENETPAKVCFVFCSKFLLVRGGNWLIFCTHLG